jgi:hypothetical protein
MVLVFYLATVSRLGGNLHSIRRRFRPIHTWVKARCTIHLSLALHLIFICTTLCVGHVAKAQSLAPRAYVITPVNANAITLSWSYFDGGLNFNGAIPVTGATGTYHVPVLSYYHSFSMFGRSANAVGFLPYGVGTFQGEVLGNQRQIYRSGLLDIALRFSVNLMGGPAMKTQEFIKWKQRKLLGASLIVRPAKGATRQMPRSKRGEIIRTEALEFRHWTGNMRPNCSTCLCAGSRAAGERRNSSLCLTQPVHGTVN